ncbi:WD repeat-containing protein 5 [Irineochytrium annulatum]|nr:WD repeat-containing protein 5 [Irineochytrium annulatum]
MRPWDELGMTPRDDPMTGLETSSAIQSASQPNGHVSHVADNVPASPVLPSRTPTPSKSPSPIEGEIRPNYRLKYTLTGHKKGVSSVKYSPDGMWLCTASADKTIRLYHAHNSRYETTLKGHKAGINDVAWSTDSRLICSASDDKTIIVWDIESEKEVAVLRGHTSYVYCVSFNAQSNLIASGSFDETVKIWDAKHGKVLKTLPAHSDPVTAVCFNRDGSLLASSGHDGLISFIKFSPNGNYILACNLDNTIKLWNTSTSKIVQTLRGHRNTKYSIFSCFSTTSGDLLVSGSEDRRIYIWDLKTRRVVQKVCDGTEYSFLSKLPSFDQLSGHSASGAINSDNTVKIWVDSKLEL